MKLFIQKELFQWEKERYVYVISEQDEPLITHIQFYNEKISYSPEIPVSKNKAKIPNLLLQYDLPIMAVACVGPLGEAEVLGRREFKVIRRKKPENYREDENIVDKHIIYDGGEEN